ncbi:LysR family transcriptional regulator [Pseudomonas luteola]|uniref:LysR family transcriptional regulator n=1 Tax=Pseudomonas luteola TaxID=47886 RepID=A0ABS0FU64_PSELU|nr:LysR substrate-binding domain-containing protein [Pseudomonas zeshuii]MBF8643870.1 LysR family transcriptional regulator [Pseudomonas zeshuii]
MDIRHFRYFLAVADSAHFTQAAARLGIAVPTLSRQIKEMEEELGVRLFDRVQRRASLTDAGHVLIAEAREVVSRFEAAQRQARRAGRGEYGRLEIGYVASAVYRGLLQRQIETFNQMHPDVQLNVREMPMAHLPQQVAEGRIDLAYVRGPIGSSEGVEIIRFDDEGFVLALHVQNPLAAASNVDPRRLAAETFILPEQLIGTLSLAELGGFNPRLGPQPGSLLAVLALVSLRQGVAVVPESIVGRLTLPQVVYRPIKGLRVQSWLGLVYRRFDKAVTVGRYVELMRHFRCSSS